MLNDKDFELSLAKRMVQNSFFGYYRGENIEKMDVKTTEELTGKVYGDYNAMAINMGIGCDCDPCIERAIIEDYLKTNL